MTSEFDKKIEVLESKNSKLEAELSILSSRLRSFESYEGNELNDEINLLKVVLPIWQRKVLVLGIALFVAIVGVVFSLSLPNKYTSEVTLLPSNMSEGNSLNKLAGQFGGLASLAGINLGGNNSTQETTALAVMTSWGFIERFLNKHDLVPEIFGAKSWNSSLNRLEYDESFFAPEKRTWINDGVVDKDFKPSSWYVFKEFKSNLSISKSDETGLVSVSIEHYSPHIATDILKKYIAEINLYIKESDKRSSLENIEFLNKQIEATQISEMQNVFFQLIEEQTKTLMLASGSDEYVFKIVNDFKVPEVKSSPKRAFIVMGFGFLGLIFGSLFVIFSSYWKKGA